MIKNLLEVEKFMGGRKKVQKKETKTSQLVKEIFKYVLSTTYDLDDICFLDEEEFEVTLGLPKNEPGWEESEVFKPDYIIQHKESKLPLFVIEVKRTKQH